MKRTMHALGLEDAIAIMHRRQYLMIGHGREYMATSPQNLRKLAKIHQGRDLAQQVITALTRDFFKLASATHQTTDYTAFPRNHTFFKKIM
jgi:hypothetical protein